MTDEVKTLAEWLLDPATQAGDAFTPERGLDELVVVNKDGTALHYVADRDEGYKRSPWGAPNLARYRSRWRRRVDLDKLTAQQALDRGILVRP